MTTTIATCVNVLSGTAADLEEGDQLLHGGAHVTRVVRDLRVEGGRIKFRAHKRDSAGERFMGDWELRPDADVLIIRSAD